MGACRKCHQRLPRSHPARGQSRWTVRVTVQMDSPGDSRRDESDDLHVASSGTSDASDMWSAIGRHPALSRLVLAGAARARARSVI